MNSNFPTIDLAAFGAANAMDKRRIAEQVDEICCEIGFLIIRNHGVEQTIIDRVCAQATTFFELPLAQKLKLNPDVAGCPRGYFPVLSETLSRSRGVESLPDRKETYSSGALQPPVGSKDIADFGFYYGENLWPESPLGFQQAWVDYYQAMEQLGLRVLQLFAEALKLPSGYFAGFHSHHISALRANYYPESGGARLSNQSRAGAHSDYGSVTILKPDPGVGGLEIQLSSGKWQPAPLVADAFIINIGDLMARWTNDRWKSTVHRVVDPAAGNGVVSKRRLSIAFFQVPNFDASIRCIPTCLKRGEVEKYASVEAGPYLKGRFLSTV